MKTIAVLLIKKDNLEPMIIKRNVKIHIKIRFNLSCETCSKYVVKRFQFAWNQISYYSKIVYQHIHSTFKHMVQDYWSYDASCCIVVSCWVERLNFKKLRSYNTQVSKPSTRNSWPTSASSISFVVLDFVQLF